MTKKSDGTPSLFFHFFFFVGNRAQPFSRRNSILLLRCSSGQPRSAERHFTHIYWRACLLTNLRCAPMSSASSSAPHFMHFATLFCVFQTNAEKLAGVRFNADFGIVNFVVYIKFFSRPNVSQVKYLSARTVDSEVSCHK